MIVVAIIGILAAIAIPAFINYIKRSKTSEATTQLKALFSGAASYYLSERTDRVLPARGASNLTITRCVVTGAQTSNAPSAAKSALDWTVEGGLATFEALNAMVADPIYYRYVVAPQVSEGSCGDTSDAGELVYRFQAIGDLDGDGVQSLFELSAGVDDGAQLYRNAAIYRERELE